MTCWPNELSPDQLHRVALGSRAVWLNPVSLKKVITANHDRPSIERFPDLYAVPEPPARPQGVTHHCLVVTNRCNLACDYCAYSTRQGGADQPMSSAVVEQVIEEIRTGSRSAYVTLLGGEPMLEWQVVKRVCDSVPNPKVLYTNGTLLDEARIGFLVDSGTSIIISVDGPDFPHNRRRYRSKRQFRATLDTMARLSNMAVPFGIATVYDQAWAGEEWRGLLGLVDDYSPASFAVNRLYFNENVALSTETGRVYAECLLLLQKELDRRGVYFESMDRYLKPLVDEEPRMFHCTAQCGRKTYFPDGSWHACQFDTLEIGEPGNLEIYSRMTPRYDQQCWSCPARGICGGGCSMTRRHLGNGSPIPDHCDFVRYLLDRLLAQLAEPLEPGPVEIDRLVRRYYERSVGGELSYPVGHSVRGS